MGIFISSSMNSCARKMVTTVRCPVFLLCSRASPSAERSSFGCQWQGSYAQTAVILYASTLSVFMARLAYSSYASAVFRLVDRCIIHVPSDRISSALSIQFSSSRGSIGTSVSGARSCRRSLPLEVVMGICPPYCIGSDLRFLTVCAATLHRAEQ